LDRVRGGLQRESAFTTSAAPPVRRKGGPAAELDGIARGGRGEPGEEEEERGIYGHVFFPLARGLR
jgi:hypothetical protein